MAKRAREESMSRLVGVEPAEDSTARAVTKYKYKHTDEADTVSTGGAGVMRCFLPPHKPLTFATYDEYDSHYQQAHSHRCTQCHKNFPSPHLTDIHIAENHDPLNEAKKARGDKIYACFVEDCDKVCATPQKRRLHLVDKHHFPKNYNFFIVNDGLDRRRSMLRPQTRQRRRSSLLTSSTKSITTPERTKEKDAAPAEPDEEADADSEDEAEAQQDKAAVSSPSLPLRKQGAISAAKKTEDEVDDITMSMSALKFVPPSVRFGRGCGRGFPKQAH